MFPWFLYERLIEHPERAVPKDAELEPSWRLAEPGTAAIRAFPAARRRRGMTSIKGYFQGLLRALDLIGNRISTSDLLNHFQSESPNLKPATVQQSVSVLERELTVIAKEGDEYVPTAIGLIFFHSKLPAGKNPIHGRSY